MRCGHCKANGPEVNVAHVKACSTYEQGIRSVGAPVKVTGTIPAYADMPVTKTLAQEPVEGFYRADGETFKVVQGTNTGNFYAKRLALTEPDCGGCANGEPCGAGCTWSFEWLYAGRKPLHNLTAADRLTAEQAAEFGLLTGACVFCSRKLTDERSIHVGYGPRCAEREGLPWGEVA